MDATPISSSVVFGYDMKIKFEPFFLDYNLEKDVVMLPTLFNREHSDKISPVVMLCDAAGNMFEVATEVRHSETFFVNGWHAVGRFYGLHAGGWCRLVFVAKNMFLIHLRDRLDRPVTYPLPARKTMLNQLTTFAAYPRTDLVASHYADICKKPDYFQILEKDLTNNDITSGFLDIPLDFCEAAFHKTDRSIVVFDEYGLQATCIVEFNNNWKGRCGIGFGWKKFCSDKCYKEGYRLQLGVPVGNPNIMSVILVKT